MKGIQNFKLNAQFQWVLCFEIEMGGEWWENVGD